MGSEVDGNTPVAWTTLVNTRWMIDETGFRDRCDSAAGDPLLAGRFSLSAGVCFCLDYRWFVELPGPARCQATRQHLNEWAWWPVIALALVLFPAVVNIGFGKAWNRWYLTTSMLALGAVTAVIGKVAYDGFLGPPVGVLVYTWVLYTFGHLGISFLLGGVLATPGCEMRSIPHLWGLLSGRRAKEHYCPGLLSPIDRWEAGLRNEQHET